MTRALHIAGAVLVLMGTIWFLQGVNVLPGSFMTGDPQWAVNGGIAVGLGLVLIAFARKRST
jgi:hypothetical protein